MKTLKEIVSFFENKNYAVRSEFINDYNFKDKHFEYYHRFILKANNIKAPLYLSDLVDLSGWLGINDKQIRDRWLSYLDENRHFVVKLAVLDYFKHTKKKWLDPAYEKKLTQLLQKGMLSILRNQVLFNLICLDSERTSYYIQELNNSLTKTTDWKSVYRTLNNLKEVKLKKEYRLLIYNHIKSLSLKRDFGIGVKKLILEIGGLQPSRR